MKYLNTIAIKSFAIYCFFFLSIVFVQAQKTTSSPYSKYGVGMIQPINFNSNFASGGIGYAWRPSVYKPQIYDSLARSNAKLNDRKTNYINGKNPASFSNISLTTFELGVRSVNTQFESNGQSRQGSNSGIGHIAVAFPVGELIGMGFSLRQYSAVGYEYETSNTANAIVSTNKYEGSGGLNELAISGAYEFMKNFSIGLNAKYIFGTIDETKRIVYNSTTSSNFFNTIDRNETNINFFSADIGLQYFKNLNSNYRLVLGLTTSPLDNVNGNQNNLLATYTGADNLERIKDTVRLLEDQKVSIPFVSTIGGGLSIERLGQWAIGLDLTLRNWSNNEIDNGIKLNNATLINFGFEKFSQVSSFGSYFKRMGYRFGLNHNSSIVNINGTDISETGITFGFSMPLRKSFSTLNFGIELGSRGEDKDGLSQENYMNIQVGVTINDKWFIKRKYD